MGTHRAIRFHHAAALELYAMDRGLIGALVARVERRVAFSLSLGDRELFVSIGTDTLTVAVQHLIKHTAAVRVSGT
jgi:hypothetical protein